MERNTQVVAVCGSLAADSVTRVAPREVLTAAQAEGAQSVYTDLREYDLPALKHFRAVLGALDAWPLPFDAATPDAHGQVSDDTLVDERPRDRVHQFGRELVQYAGVAGYPASSDPPASNLHAD
ncbi:MAG: NAD(P)H-dependent FMN reductase [Haloarculaceae archaeon]|jgi:NAD(P)H-dependent FMN reductase